MQSFLRSQALVLLLACMWLTAVVLELIEDGWWSSGWISDLLMGLAFGMTLAPKDAATARGIALRSRLGVVGYVALVLAIAIKLYARFA